MKAQLCAIAIISATTAVADVSCVQTQLSRMGFDPGPIDGLLGNRTRAAALNWSELTAKEMPELSQDTGDTWCESLKSYSMSAEWTAMQARFTPWDFEERAGWLAANQDYARKACSEARVKSIPVLSDVTMATGGSGITSSDELGDVWASAVSSATGCLVGKPKACRNIVQALAGYVDRNGLRYSGSPNRSSSQFTDTQLEVNIALTPLIGGYYLAKLQGQVSADEMRRIEPWLAEKTRFYNTYSSYYQDNHLTTAAIVNAIMGLVVDEQEFLHRAERQYRAALAGMRRDGSFPTETERGASAVYYTGFEIDRLVNLAELLAMGGIDVFERAPGMTGIHLAVNFYLDILEDWDGVVGYARANVAPHEDVYPVQVIPYPRLIFGGLEAYRTRYPEHPNAKRITNLRLDERTCDSQTNYIEMINACGGATGSVLLTDAFESAIGKRDMSIANAFCMFGLPN